MNEQDDSTHLAEEYSPGYGNKLVSSYDSRTIGVEAAFFAPFIRPGMQILDCGCGPGSILLGLAGLVAPGAVTGFDINPDQVKLARRSAADRDVDNAEFKTASIYDLPFPDASFDGALAHALLQHLADPEAALSEIRRVLKPSGVVGLRDDDVGSLLLAPELPLVDRVLEVMHGIVRISGGNPTVGRHHKQLLRKCGFVDIVVSTTTECDGTIEETTKRGDLAAELLQHMAEKAITNGLSTPSEMDALIPAIREWGRHPDAFDSIIWCEAVGRKP